MPENGHFPDLPKGIEPPKLDSNLFGYQPLTPRFANLATSRIWFISNVVFHALAHFFSKEYKNNKKIDKERARARR